VRDVLAAWDGPAVLVDVPPNVVVVACVDDNGLGGNAWRVPVLEATEASADWARDETAEDFHDCKTGSELLEGEAEEERLVFSPPVGVDIAVFIIWLCELSSSAKWLSTVANNYKTMV
jgi:hypothetical protein